MISCFLRKFCNTSIKVEGAISYEFDGKSAIIPGLRPIRMVVSDLVLLKVDNLGFQLGEVGGQAGDVLLLVGQVLVEGRVLLLQDPQLTTQSGPRKIY